MEIDVNKLEWATPTAEPKNKETFDKAIKIKYQKLVCESVNKFQRIVELPLQPKIQYRIITTLNFNALTVLNAMLDKYVVQELTIAIYRMNIGAVETIKDFALSGTPTNILLSAFFRENKKYERWTQLIEEYATQIPKLKVAFAWNHAKVCLIKTQCNRHIVFEGSGNLSDNARIEQYILEDNKEAYNFHYNWIKELINGKIETNPQNAYHCRSDGKTRGH